MVIYWAVKNKQTNKKTIKSPNQKILITGKIINSILGRESEKEK